MSQTPSKAARFQTIFNAALKSYQKQTKRDLVAHPLTSRLQSCDSTGAILGVLQDQVREFDQACSEDDRLTKWLGPTVNVLYAFSAALGEGVGAAFSPARVIFAGIGVVLVASIISIYLGISFKRWSSCRRPRALRRVKILWQRSSIAWDTFSHGSKLIQR
ncbi:hypothetical protein EDB83DRAFT_1497580 [Lactarius deliciosus]|nr:hypothetical protein EDB83DRAFT_1497580 [Lactarius deliciosus]